MNQAQLQAIQDLTVKACENPSFVHHYWYKQYHLDLVHRISTELFDHYPKADQTIVEALVWLHDYEKFVDFDNQYNTELEATITLLNEAGVEGAVINQLTDYLNIFNAKSDIEHAPIEVQIVSSADGAAHMVGPFYPVFWYENPTLPMDEMLVENRRKNNVDWDKKIVLPEVREAFAARHQHLNEILGEFPAKFLG